MNLNEFSIVLPSNSSVKYFPNNTTTNFSTRLPREVELYGKWSVGISEIHIPCTMLHLRQEDTRLSWPDTSYENCFQHGVYNSIQSLIQSINDGLLKYHDKNIIEKLAYDDKGGFVTFTDYRNNFPGRFLKYSVLSNAVKRILGFEFTNFNETSEEPDYYKYQIDTNEVALPHSEPEKEKFQEIRKIIADQPASLARAIPDQLFIYSNLCEPSIVGDTHASLLRIVNLNYKEYNFGSTIVKRFAPVNYVPLLSNRFQIIDIDIRDQFGNSIPFEFGTLTVTLHFKKEF